jgi:IPT/TIG domain-containing protein/List-Bact-rpt repeat protein
MNLVEPQRALHQLRMLGRLLGGLLVATLMPLLAIADTPIASSSFVGAEDPLSENGAWAALTSLSPNGTRFQKNNGAYPDQLINANHAGARTTAVVPADHYSEIIVGHVGSNTTNNCCNNVGPMVRVQASGPALDSHYLWWASRSGGVNALYRIDANGTTFTSNRIILTSPVSDGDRLRLIARGPVIYGIKNGVRDFIYHTGPDTTTYSTGTAGMLAYPSTAVTDAMIASWSSGPAPVSSGTWASSTFAGTENPLDEGDRWYPLPGYSGFKKTGGLASGRDAGHNASGVWSITPPATQYSEVTLGTVASGGGGPIVRIDRNNPGQTGWLLFLWADQPGNSGIYKMTPSGGFTSVRPFFPTIVSGDKWRLTANGNTLDVYRNGVFQFTYTTDGSYATGDVGIEAFTPNFTFMGWEGGAIAGGPPAPTITSFTPTSGKVGDPVTISGTNFTGATAVTFNGVSASFTVSSATAIQATVPAGATTGPISVTTPGGTATSASTFTVTASPPPPPTITSFTPTSGPVGTGVTISGTNFTGATAVSFNGVSASFTVSSATAIAATVPSGATSGPISVTTPGGTATSASSFTVTASAPTITSFTPASGPVGTSVTISGTNFTGATAVTFNGVSASFTVSSATAIAATVPSGATSGPISVTTPGGTATSTNNFTVTVTLTVTKTGIIGGTVTSGDSGINCGATCSASYNSGTTVTLTATPNLLSVFIGWSGCDTDSGTTCTVTMIAARAVTANFLP